MSAARPLGPLPAATIEVLVEAAGWKAALPRAGLLARRAAAAALKAVRGRSRRAVELSIILSHDRRLRALNRHWRGKDKPTNVLSFPAMADAPARAPLLLGDVVLALETLEREARAAGKPLGEHFQHLVVHGVLHLNGFDHENDRDAAVMEPMETRILARLGIADPYGVAEKGR